MHLSSATHVVSAGFEGLAPQGPPTNVEYPPDAIRQRVLTSTRKQGGFNLVLALRITQLSHVYFEKIFQGGVFLI